MQDLNNTKKMKEKKSLKTKLMEFDWLTLILGIIILSVVVPLIVAVISKAMNS